MTQRYKPTLRLIVVVTVGLQQAPDNHAIPTDKHKLDQIKLTAKK